MTELASLTQVKKVLAQNNFEYQRVFLPYGLHTPGEDRSGTLRSIFPLSLENCSVLDIGSANGFFCFEAEKRGATRVVGVELKDTRFHHSLILRDILRSKVEFLQKDILQEDLGEQFDYVLCLNVLHHVKYPMFMLRKLSQLTRKKLILEIPTLSDPKFLKTLPFLGRLLAPILNRIPLIGASSLSDSGIDQTFVFSESAIKRILTDHEQMFSKVLVERSPMGRGRIILVCMK